LNNKPARHKQAYDDFIKRFTVVALIVVGIAFPACAQRSASRGGFSGRSGSAFHGSFSAPNRFTGSAHYSGSRALSTARGIQRPGAGNFNTRPAYTGARRNRRPYRATSRAVTPYVVAPWSGWIGPYTLGYQDDSGDSESTAASSDASVGNEGYDGEPIGLGQPVSDPYLRQSHSSPAPESEAPVTLVFKDGRPSEQIHNYLLTQKILYVLDQHQRNIPTEALDLAATTTVNQNAGVDFRLPVAPQ